MEICRIERSFGLTYSYTGRPCRAPGTPDYYGVTRSSPRYVINGETWPDFCSAYTYRRSSSSAVVHGGGPVLACLYLATSPRASGEGGCHPAFFKASWALRKSGLLRFIEEALTGDRSTHTGREASSCRI